MSFDMILMFSLVSQLYDCLSMQASTLHVYAIVNSNDDQVKVNQNWQFHDLRGRGSRAIVIIVKMHYLF